MIDCVLAVMAAVENKMSLSIYDNVWLKKYLFKQTRKHRTRHHLECNSIVKVMMDRAMLEMKKMIKQHQEELGDSFLSGTTDFWTYSYCKQQFGAFVVDAYQQKSMYWTKEQVLVWIFYEP